MSDHGFLLLLGGDDVAQSAAHADLADELDPDLVVVAADSGLARAAGLRRHVDHLVGDLDSVAPSDLAAAEVAGTVVHRHRADKDATDAELALDLILFLADRREDPTPLVVVGTRSGRLDHLLADLLLFSSPVTEGLAVRAWFGPALVQIVRPGRPVTVEGRAGEQVSVLPMHGPAFGVTTSGLRWPLLGATLRAGTTRGVSNELVDTSGTVAVGDGVLAVVQQGIVAPAPADRDLPYDPTPTA